MSVTRQVGPSALRAFRERPVAGPVFLLLAVLIFGTANAVIRKLTALGSVNLVNGHNPISFCNVLFVGNLCALAILLIIYRGQWSIAAFRKLSTQQVLSMLTVACLGTALAPALIFSALEHTPVNTVVLVSRIEPPLILALSVILLGERVNRWIVGGAALSFAGVVLSLALQPRSVDEATMGMGSGEFWTALAAIALALSTVVSKIGLREIPIGLFSIFRMALGTIVFFVLALVLFGPGHFMDVSAPFLWRWIVLYSACIVVAGQLFWYKGLRGSSASEVSLASTLNPVAGFATAFVILGESPNLPQIVGGVVILAGMILNQYGLHLLDDDVDEEKQLDEVAAADAAGFKGV